MTPWVMAGLLCTWVLIAVRIWPARPMSMSAARQPAIDWTVLMGFILPMGLQMAVGVLDLAWLMILRRSRRPRFIVALIILASWWGTMCLLGRFIASQPVVVL